VVEQGGVEFEPTIGDGERLPFPAGTFDVVFFCGALHHFERFEVVLREVRRVLRPGGRLIATGEPAISVAARERDVQSGLEEVREGIGGRRPRVIGYWLPAGRGGVPRGPADAPPAHRP